MPRGYVPEAGYIVWLTSRRSPDTSSWTPTRPGVEYARVQRENKPDGLLSDDNAV